MDNSKNIRTSLCIFLSVFFITLFFNYFYQCAKNKDDKDYKFDWNKYTLISSAWGSGVALIFSVYFMFQTKKQSSSIEYDTSSPFSPKSLKMKMGCLPCQGIKQGMSMPFLKKKYSMECQ